MCLAFTINIVKLRNPAGRNYLITLITAIILIGLFVVYYFGYVSARETYLNERNFRILTQINQNIQSKNQNNLRSARNIVNRPANEIKTDILFYLESHQTIPNNSLSFYYDQPLSVITTNDRLKLSKLPVPLEKLIGEYTSILKYVFC